MKTLYESILDDEDIVIKKAEDYNKNPFLAIKDYFINGGIKYQQQMTDIQEIIERYKVMDNIPEDCYLNIGRFNMYIEVTNDSDFLLNMEKKSNDKCSIAFYEWFGQYNGEFEIIFKTKSKYLKWIKEFTKRYNMKKINDFEYEI